MPDITVTAHQPLALGTRPAGTETADTHRYIPGSVLRGALAAAWIGEHDAPREQKDPAKRREFVTLFEGTIRYGPLFHPNARVVPLSVFRCKYRPTAECAVEIHDELTGAKPSRCSVCQGPVTRGKGEVEHFGPRDAHVLTETTRVQLTAQETAQEGKLFTRRALGHLEADGEPGRTYRGRIVGTDAWLRRARDLWMGGRRSTSGAVTYHAADEVDTSVDAHVPVLDDNRLVLRLVTPAVLVDACGLPTDELDTEGLSRLLGTSVTTRERHTRPAISGGWHAASNLPKPDEHVVSAGSVYVLRLGDTPPPEALRQLVDHGVGLRRNEGFGWIELGLWQPPRTALGPEVLRPQDEATPHRPKQVQKFVHKVENSKHRRWFLRVLREQAQRRRQGNDIDWSLLERDRASAFEREHSGALCRALAEFDADDLTAVVRKLEQSVRGVGD